MDKYIFDELKFSEKYDKYYILVYRTAYNYMLNVAVAEDITQEVFVKLLTHKKSFKENEHEKAWLLRVTINLCKNTLKSSSYNNLPLNDEIEIQDNSFEENVDEKIDVQNQLKKLNSEQRTAIYLYYFENFTIKEISKIMKLNENTVKSHLKRAKQKLKINILKENDI